MQKVAHDFWYDRRTTRNTHNRHTSMLPTVGFEPTISAGELPQTYALDGAAAGTGKAYFTGVFYITVGCSGCRYNAKDHNCNFTCMYLCWMRGGVFDLRNLKNSRSDTVAASCWTETDLWYKFYLCYSN